MSEAFTLDFVVMWAQTRRYLLLMAICGIVVGIFSGPLAIAFFVGLTMLTTAMNLASLDDHPGWNSFRGSLPASRADLVWGRYLTMALLALICWGIAVASSFIVWGLQLAIPGLVEEGVNSINPATAVGDIFINALTVNLLELFVVVCMLPPLICMGQVKGLKWSVLCLAGGLVVCIGVFWAFGGLDLLLSIIAYDGVTEGVQGFGSLGPILGVIAGLCVVAYFVSVFFTIAAFSRREL